MRLGILGAAALTLGCGTSAPPPASPVPEPACVVAVEHPGGRLAVAGVEIAVLDPVALSAILGGPDRIERVEWSHGTGSRKHGRITIVDVHHVYDDLGLVLRTSQVRKRPDPGRTVLRVFMPEPLPFTSLAPEVQPARGGGCSVDINGVRLDPDADLRPPRGTEEGDAFERFGTRFVQRSSGDLDLHVLATVEGARSIGIHVDARDTGRASFVEIH